MDIREIGYDDVVWNLPHNTDKWRVLVNTVMNLRVPGKGARSDSF